MFILKSSKRHSSLKPIADILIHEEVPVGLHERCGHRGKRKIILLEKSNQPSIDQNNQGKVILLTDSQDLLLKLR